MNERHRRVHPINCRWMNYSGPNGEAVRIDGVSLEIGEHRLIDDLSLSVQPGEVLALLGPSGCGKTTTIKLINGLLLPTRGTVWIEGRATTDWDKVRLRRRIGYVIQETGLFPHYTVEQNIALVPRLEGWEPGQISERVLQLMQLLHLGEGLKGRYPWELSGGQRQRVGIARALAADPPILLMDEPFASLDPLTRLDVRNEFIGLQRTLEKTTVFVTHDVQEAFQVADRIGLMERGRLVELASPEGFLDSATPLAQSFIECLGSGFRKRLDQRLKS